MALLLCDCDAGADAVAQRLLEAVRSLGIEHGGGTAALRHGEHRRGHARADAPAASEHLLRMADVALYRAKAAGRDRADARTGGRRPAAGRHLITHPRRGRASRARSI